MSEEDQRKVSNLTYFLVAEGVSKGVEAADAIGLSPEYIDAFHELAAAAIIVLLAVLLTFNAVAVVIRQRLHRSSQ